MLSGSNATTTPNNPYRRLEHGCTHSAMVQCHFLRGGLSCSARSIEALHEIALPVTFTRTWVRPASAPPLHCARSSFTTQWAYVTPPPHRDSRLMRANQRNTYTHTARDRTGDSLASTYSDRYGRLLTCLGPLVGGALSFDPANLLVQHMLFTATSHLP